MDTVVVQPPIAFHFMKNLLSLLLLACLTLVGCKSSVSLEPITSVTNPAWDGGKPYEVMVVGFAYEAENRIRFEDSITETLTRSGIKARRSYEVYPALQTLTVPAMNAYLSSSPNAAILFGHAVAITRDEVDTGKRVMSTGLMGGTESIDWDIEISALLESALYVSEAPTAVWVDRTRLRANSDVGVSGVNIYINHLTSALKRDRIIQRLK